MKAINILKFYDGLGKSRDDLNKPHTLTGNTTFCPSCAKDMPTIKSKYGNRPAERCSECGKMLIVN